MLLSYPLSGYIPADPPGKLSIGKRETMRKTQRRRVSLEDIEESPETLIETESGENSKAAGGVSLLKDIDKLPETTERIGKAVSGAVASAMKHAQTILVEVLAFMSFASFAWWLFSKLG
jgi:hypothetical protein